jgi:hypothetical protein
MPRIRMITLLAGPTGVHQPGSVREVSRKEADALIAAHAAVEITPVEKAVRTAPETTAGAPQQPHGR